MQIYEYYQQMLQIVQLNAPPPLPSAPN